MEEIASTSRGLDIDVATERDEGEEEQDEYEIETNELTEHKEDDGNDEENKEKEELTDLQLVFSIIAGNADVITAEKLLESTKEMGFDFTLVEIKEMIEVADPEDSGTLTKKDFASMVYTSKEEITSLSLSKEQIRRELTSLSFLSSTESLDKEKLDSDTLTIEEEETGHNKDANDGSSDDELDTLPNSDTKRGNDITLTRLNSESDSVTDWQYSREQSSKEDDHDIFQDVDEDKVQEMTEQNRRIPAHRAYRSQKPGEIKVDKTSGIAAKHAMDPKVAGPARHRATSRQMPVSQRDTKAVPIRRSSESDSKATAHPKTLKGGQEQAIIVRRNEENRETNRKPLPNDVPRGSVQQAQRRGSKAQVKYVRRSQSQTSTAPTKQTLTNRPETDKGKRPEQQKGPASKTQVFRRKSTTTQDHKAPASIRSSMIREFKKPSQPAQVKATQRPTAIGCVYKMSRMRMKQRVLYTMWRALFQQIVETHVDDSGGTNTLKRHLPPKNKQIVR